MLFKKVITGTEHVVGDPDCGGHFAGFLVHNRKVDLLEDIRQRPFCRVPGVFQVSPASHSPFVALSHQPDHGI